jgi:transposase-like protein
MRIHDLLEAKPNPITTDEIDQIRDLYNQGLGVMEISKRLKRGARIVIDTLDKIFPDRKRRNPAPLSDSEIDQLKKLYSRGVGPSEISKILGRNKSLIGKKLNDLYPTRDKQKNRPFSDSEIEQIKQLYNQGLGSYQISKILNRGPGLIQAKLDVLFPDRIKYGIATPLTDSEIEQIKQLYNQNVSISEISKTLGRNEITIRKKLDHLYPTRNKVKHQPFSKEGVKLIRDLYQQGYGTTYIADKVSKLENIVRHNATISTKLRSFPDFESVLLPSYLENIQKIWGTSRAEINFFDELSNIPGIPKDIERNVQIKREKSFYNIDGIVSNKVAIEFFGSLWHADTSMFPDPEQYIPKLGCTAGEVREKDQRKISWLEQQGYHVVVIWENEWKKKATRQACIDRVLAAFNKK